MTCYHGGKQFIGKEVAEIIMSIAGDNFNYLEPFCGMLGVFQHISKNEYRIISDSHEHIIEMWKFVQKGWLPPKKHYTEAAYNALKNKSGRNIMHLKGFVGHHYSYGGTFFGSYRFNSVPIVNISKTIDRFHKIANTLKGAHIMCADYMFFSNLTGFVIYCDPPYKGTKCNYENTFDNEKFLDWCEDMTERGNTIFVSEYKIKRRTFKKIATFDNSRGGYKGRQNKAIESLFICIGADTSSDRFS